MAKSEWAKTSREAELEEMVAVLRQALEKAPARWVIQHHLYDAWVRDQRDPVLAVTK